MIGLKKVSRQAIKTVNFIKAHALQSPLFVYTQRSDGYREGKVLTRLFELRHEVFVFSCDTYFELKDCFADELCLCTLAYLAEIFSKLNELNETLQGNHNTPFQVYDRVNAIKKELNQAAKKAQEKKIGKKCHCF